MINHRRMRLLFLLATCLVSQIGVAATGPEEKREEDKKEFSEVSKRYLAYRKEVVGECITEAKSYKSSTSFSQNTQFSIAAAGVIAGAVIVPALAAKVAAKSVVAAWGGVGNLRDRAQLKFKYPQTIAIINAKTEITCTHSEFA